MTHMDTVPLCAGAKPKLAGPQDRQRGENRARRRQPHRLRACWSRWRPSLRSKNSIIRRSRCCSPCARRAGCLARATSNPPISASPVMAFNYDGGSASNVTIGAVGADRWQVEIFGRASHAGVAPERGISSTMILALALAEVKAGGWFGKVTKGQAAGHQQCRPGHRRRRPAGRRRHQRRHRLRACARRKPQPRRKVLQGDHQSLQGGVRESGQARQEQRGQVGPRQVQGARPTIIRSA